MARVASCPQCEHDLLVPDDAEPSALVKCPECRAFFELQHAASRELPAALVVQSRAATSGEAPALAEEFVTAEYSPLAAFPSTPDTTPDSETPDSEIDQIKIEPDAADILDFADDAPAAEYGSTSLPAPHLAEDLPPFAEDPQSYEAPGTESHEEAAQRIDQWFRSAKTLSDLPPLELPSQPESAQFDSLDLEPSVHPEIAEQYRAIEHQQDITEQITEIFEPANHSASDTTTNHDEIGVDEEITVQFDSGNDDAVGEFANAETNDWQLEPAADLPADSAPWDDSQHMDRLLADIEGAPIDTFEPASQDELVAYEESVATHDEQDPESQEFHAGSDWTPDDSLALPNAPSQPERKRSVVRTLVGSAVGGVFGLALAYYALLWLGPVLHRDKDIDFLQVANYLPKSILPPAFRKEVKPAPAQPPKMVQDLAVKESTAKPAEQGGPEEPKAAEPVAPPATAATAATVEHSPPASETKQASATEDASKKMPSEAAQATFTTPPAPVKKKSDDDDRYANPSSKIEPTTHEPAPLSAPPAKAIADVAPKAEPVHIASAPKFAAADVAASLTAANAAAPGLVTGSLQDGKEVTRTKGVSYMAIADFAQKATFADAADTAKAKQESDEFFSKLLSNSHTRDEVAQIAPRWMNHPKRAQNGVFLAGIAAHGENRGSVVEYNVELSGGPSVVVVVPAGSSLDSPTKPVAVVGSIVDHPADDIAGYTGKAPQVIFAKKLLPLE